jgi:TPR repeat protein
MSRTAQTIVAIIVLALTVSTSAYADILAAGRAAFTHGNYGLAARLLIPPAERGNASAQAMLGFMYETGQGVPQAYDAAAYWYQLSAEQGNTTAQYLLGLMYTKGQGVPLDNVAAYKWLNLAAAGAPNRFRENYKRLRDAVATKMSLSQIAEGQWRALQWTARSASERQ